MMFAITVKLYYANVPLWHFNNRRVVSTGNQACAALRYRGV